MLLDAQFIVPAMKQLLRGTHALNSSLSRASLEMLGPLNACIGLAKGIFARLRRGDTMSGAADWLKEMFRFHGRFV